MGKLDSNDTFSHVDVSAPSSAGGDFHDMQSGHFRNEFKDKYTGKSFHGAFQSQSYNSSYALGCEVGTEMSNQDVVPNAHVSMKSI